MVRLLAVSALLLSAGAVQAQTTQACPDNDAVCIVQSGQTLNLVINGDTTATGDRLRTDRIYQLQRNSVYLMNGDVRNSGYHLRIFGEESDQGSIPQVYTVLNPDSGNRVGDPFGMQGDLTLQNFAMAGVLPSSPLSDISTRVVRVREPGFNLIMDRFIAVNFQASIVRAQSALNSFTMTNSMWINSGWLGDNGTNFGAGKGIDLRDGSIQDFVMQNNTLVNYTDRVIRHRNSTAAIENFVFDHNTIINAVSYHGTLALGEVGGSARITNNLFYDSFVAGGDSSDVVRQEEFNESGELYPNGRPAMHWISSVPNDATNWTVANNAYVVTDAVEDFYAAFGDGGGDDGNPDNGTDGDNDIIDEGAKLTDHILSRISNPTTAFAEFDFDFANAPDAPIDMVTWYREETGRTKETITFDVATDDYDRRDVQYFLNDFDASFPTDNPAYTAAANGCPVGDLNWFSGLDVEACLSVANEQGPLATTFSLSSAPNPFRGSTTIGFSLEEGSDVTLRVYDALGRHVTTLATGAYVAGDHTAQWNASGAAPGLYIVRLEADGVVGTHQTLVVR